MKRLFTLIALCCSLTSVLMAQPQKTRTQSTRPTTSSTTRRTGTAQPQQTVSRASLMFPTAVDVPEEVTWRRDIYRELDLSKNENAALYFPVDARGKDVNLFTLLFQLLNQGKIPAYQYQTDGKENFTPENRMHFKDMLERYNIYYEASGNSIKVDPADIPSSEVKSIFVKESSYYDQNTATYHSRVTAICPVLHRSDDFSYEALKYPLFWVKYDDVKTYLSSHSVMTSNLNNAASMSMDDFFSTNHYSGKIYMTTNMQNKTLQEMCPSDSLMKKEQARIEKEISDFEEHIWKAPVDSAEIARQDSIAAASQVKSKKVKSASSSASSSRSARRTTSEPKAKSSSSKNSSAGGSSSNAPRVSVRRQRH